MCTCIRALTVSFLAMPLLCAAEPARAPTESNNGLNDGNPALTELKRADARVTIDPGKHLGRISPLLYGLRGADTFKNDTPLMWVGPSSPIANIDGVRKGTVEALRKIQPGFMSGLVGAEWYRWQDGIGPRDKRPVRVSYWGRSAFEAVNMEWRNEFGTEEFLHLCRLVGTEPLMICNAEDPVGSRDWVEYCNWDGDSTFARIRAANGHPPPHGVTLWNMYGWMDMEPEEYASSFRRFASGVRPLDPKTKLIAAGGGNAWNQRFFDKLKRCMSPNFGGPDVVDYLSQIYYTGQNLPDVDYSDEQYYRVLQNSFGLARPEDSKGSGGAVAGSAVKDLPELPMLSASASVAEDGNELVVTVTNCHLTEPARVALAIVGGGQWRIASLRTLSAQSVRDHNTVENPDRVGVHAQRVEGDPGNLVVMFDPHSVSALVLKR